ncbi:uncharacterized protein LOC126898463 isoform X2 [Daktulosphaira vitifoliae]|uniref:uncharacterized protein LOC126898463 isoform X2 n=1 Tax=Daktulosphaira vitifoliae TaxID=58002 RepID=UPI0021AA628D|nr:uncharacterized protein LOC126898463 isoform X2 [Daktulosphaira vitifoliae]
MNLVITLVTFLISFLYESCGLDKQRECSICFNEFKGLVLITNCQHVYCYGCLKNWRKRNSSCPKCREEIYKQIYQYTKPIGAEDMIDSWKKPKIHPGLTREEELLLLKLSISRPSRYIHIFKEMVARYLFLIPNHYADKQLLIDIGTIIYNFNDILPGLHQWTINVKTPHEEDLVRRCSFRMNLTETESTILREYYLRHNLDPDEQFEIRKEFVRSIDFVYAPRSGQ